MEKNQDSYPKARNTVDAVVLVEVSEGNKHKNNCLHVLLIKRGKEPFKGMWALPGGHINVKEDPYDAAHRELKEETGYDAEELYPLGSFNINDPRGWTISAAYLAVASETEMKEIEAGDDASEADWFNIKELPDLAFGHKKVIIQAVEEYRKFE